jgi:hypothetical protein
LTGDVGAPDLEKDEKGAGWWVLGAGMNDELGMDVWNPLHVSVDGFSVMIDSDSDIFPLPNVYGFALAAGQEQRAEGTATSSEEEPKKKSASSSKKRDRVQGQLEVVPGQVCLPKEVELEVSSLADFEEYVARLSQHVTDEQKTQLNNQRKRIRNRLYALQKRQKEKELKQTEGGEVQKLRNEVARLTHENAMLRDENMRLRKSSFPAGRVSAFAIVVAFSVFAAPMSGWWSGQSSFSTGRSLMATSEPASGRGWPALGWWGKSSVGGVSVLHHSVRDFSACDKAGDNSTAVLFKCLKYI